MVRVCKYAKQINRNHNARLGTGGPPQVKTQGPGPAQPEGREPGTPVRRRVQTIKKSDVGSNKKTAPVVNARKLDEGTEPAALEKVPTEVRHAIQKARLEKKMSQAELAKQINERPQVVQEYENGKAVPNQAVLAKMERVLGVKLRGKISGKGGL